MQDTHNSLWFDLTRLYSTQSAREAVKCIVRPLFAKLVGTNELQKQVDTLYYFLNYCVDIRNVLKATGPMRQLQEADVEFLRLFHETCAKNHLNYWVDGGTLLGAVRHSLG